MSATPDPDATMPSVVSWRIPTPAGLWYQAVVAVDRGIFLTDRIDVTTLNSIEQAATQGTQAVVKALADHGRAKRPSFCRYEELRGMRANHGAGIIEIDTEQGLWKANVPNRERLQGLGAEIKDAVRRSANRQAAG